MSSSRVPADSQPLHNFPLSLYWSKNHLRPRRPSKPISSITLLNNPYPSLPPPLPLSSEPDTDTPPTNPTVQTCPPPIPTVKTCPPPIPTVETCPPPTPVPDHTKTQEEREKEEEEEKVWMLRPRKVKIKIRYGNRDGGGSSRAAALPEEKRVSEGDKKKKEKFSISLSKKEIEEDFLAMTGSKPPRRPHTRSKAVQKRLDEIFPGLCLDSITRDRYKVNEVPDN